MRQWVHQARPNEEFIYSHDTMQVRRGQDGRTEAAQIAWNFYMKGLVHLVQRRKSKSGALDGGGTFDYIMVRTRLDNINA
jgi:hypothetical protein